MSQEENTIPNKVTGDQVTASEINQLKDIQNNNSQDSLSKEDGGEILNDVTLSNEIKINFKDINGDVVGNISGSGIDILVASSEIKVYWLPNGSVITVDPSAGDVIRTLPNASDHIGKEFTIKRINNGANIVSISPATGEYIDNTDDAKSIRLGLNNDSIRLISDGAKWLVTGRNSECWGSLLCDTEYNQSLTTSDTLLNCFNVNNFSTPGRAIANSSNGEINLMNIETPKDGHVVYFNISFEFPNNDEVIFTLYIDGVPTNISATKVGRGNNKPVSTSFTMPVRVVAPEPKALTIFARGDSAGNIKVLNAAFTSNRIGG